MGRSRILRGALVVLLAGTVLSVVATVLTATHADDRRDALLSSRADGVLVQSQRRLADAMAANAGLVGAISDTWLTPAQYEAVSLRALLSESGHRRAAELVIRPTSEDDLGLIEEFLAASGRPGERVGNAEVPDLLAQRTVVSGPSGATDGARLVDEVPVAALLDLAPGAQRLFFTADGVLIQAVVVDVSPTDGETRTGLQLASVDLAGLADGLSVDATDVGFALGAVAPAQSRDLELDVQPDPAGLGDGTPLFVNVEPRPGFADDRVPNPSTMALIFGFLTLLAAAVSSSVIGVQEVGRRLKVSEHDAGHDGLTGTWNRRRLLSELETFATAPPDRPPILGQLTRTGREQRSDNRRRLLAVLFCDLDRFKVVNDSVGHTIGDHVLCVVSRRLAALRADGCVTRFGGDEFVLIVPVASSDEAVEIAEDLRTTVGREIFHDGARYSISASVGVVVAEPGSRFDPSDLLRDADMAAYAAKRAGGDGVAVFDDSLRAAAMDRLDVEQALRLAISEDQFEVLYQPLTDRDGHVVSLESLVRWQRPGHGLVSPVHFLEAASEIGLLPEIGRTVLRRACANGARWLADLPGTHPLTVNVNIDMDQLLELDFPQTVLAVLEETGFPADRLVLEITENALPAITDSVRASLESLRQAGVEFSIDDFGTGHSSLERLVLFDEVSEVKIDRSFTSRADSSVAALAVIKAVALLARELNLRLVLEGVERAEEIEATLGLGITSYQGYLLGRPVAEDIVTSDYLTGPVMRMPRFDRAASLAALATEVRADAEQRAPEARS